jgi:hypothetical protein
MTLRHAGTIAAASATTASRTVATAMVGVWRGVTPKS